MLEQTYLHEIESTETLSIAGILPDPTYILQLY